MSEQWLELTVDDSTMRVFQTLPERSEAGPGIVMAMHAPGLDEFTLKMCRDLADAGIAASAPDLFHRQAPDAALNPIERLRLLDDREVFRDMSAASAQLRQHELVHAAQFGVVGFCMGGRLALLQAAKDASLAAAVMFYGGFVNEVWRGSAPATSEDGAEQPSDTPSVPSSESPGATPLALAPQITCPILGLYGSDDENPSPADVAVLQGCFEASGVVHEMHSYAGAGHAFLNFLRETHHRPEAGADAWHKCVAWLQLHLADASPGFDG